MTVHLHHLKGCAPAPLAHYLKALGILRIVAEQKDAAVRGWWENVHFCLLTTLDRAQLERFFLEEYKPTPLLAPWNGASGFFRTWDKKTRRLRKSKNGQALEELVASADVRLSLFKDAHRLAVSALTPRLRNVDVGAMTDDDRKKLLIVPDGEGPIFPVATKDDEGKGAVQRAMLQACSGNPFYGSSIVDTRDDNNDGKIRYPSLWGSGGNDGAIDYSGRYFENVRQVTTEKHSASWLRSALSGEIVDDVLSGAAGKIGQFLPIGAGGANVANGPGTQNDTQLNPWDFVLMLEGAVLFVAGLTKRLGSTETALGAVPFAVHAQSAGHASTGQESSERGEQWMPLWSRPASLTELRALLLDGRAQIGRRTARRPIDFVRAISKLGVASGLSGFMRFGYLERNGQSILAVPLGRIDVLERPQSRLIDEIAPWLERLHQLASDRHAPARLVLAERRLANAIFAVLTHDNAADRWQAILLAAVSVEAIQVGGTAFKAGPIPALAPEWVVAADDGSTEFRLARALGSAASTYDRAGRAFDPVRFNWLPLQKGTRRFQENEKRLVRNSRVVIGGRDPVADLSALVERRLIDAAQRGQRNLPLVAAPGCCAHPADLAELIAGHVDVARVSALARAFMAVRWHRWRSTQLGATPQGACPEEAWMALRLACLPWKLDDNRTIPADEAIVRRLIAGDAAAAVEVALHRLRAAGLRPPLQGACAEPATARLWAAALAFPISLTCARAMASDFERANQKEFR